MPDSFGLASREAKSAPEKVNVDRRFTNTKTGLIGVQRDTMLDNELHINSELGRTKRRGHRLPPTNFTYGATYEKIDGGVPEALQHWVKERESNDDSRYKVIRDFVALNKAALKSGCCTTKENDNFRALNDIKKRVRIGGSGYGGSSGDVVHRKPVQFPSDMVFGHQNRPSTPVAEVLGHHYLHDWVNNMQAKRVAQVEAQKEATKAISGAYHTKSSWLKNAKIPVDEKPHWKMPKFRNAEAAIDTFQTDFQRQKALTALDFDKIPRQGVNNFKQGIYNVNTTSLRV